MIEDAGGPIDYDESGAGPTVVFVPGSCSTGAAWRPVITALNTQFRCVTTSLPGYGGTAERRPSHDPSISHQADAVEAVVRRAGEHVHLVGHSAGAFVALVAALRRRVSLASLVIIEAPAVELLKERGEDLHYDEFRRMTQAYFADFKGGNQQAIESMVDFYGGPGTFASWPARVRAYAIETTPVNILDWAGAYNFPVSAEMLASIEIPVLVIRGGASHPAMQRLNELICESIENASLVTIEGAAHFMIATHADDVGPLIADHVRRTDT
jgi:pimeloyl-ACP methyl ester carboxylesterase